MAKVKYYFDYKTLSYIPVIKSRTLQVSNFILFILSAIIFGIFSLFILLNFNIISTPKEIIQDRELENYALQYDLMSLKLNQIENVLENVQERDNNLYRVYFEASPIPLSQRIVGFGGINRYKNLEGFENSEIIVDASKRLDVLSKQLVVQSKSLDEIEYLASNKVDLLSAIPSIQPIRNKDLKRLASGYGYRSDPFTKKPRMHWGMDFTAPKGTPIYATGDGLVKRADNRASGYGKHIRVDHGFGYVSLYAHMNKFQVKRGQKVKRGEIIGYVGNTGRSAGPHLHYEVFKDGEKINPLNFYYGNLSSEEFDILLNLASQENQSLD